jgi:hypothetical protein
MRLAHLIAAIAGVALVAAPAFAHRVHAGVTEITINDRTSEMEIAHRVFAHDLMEAMQRDDREIVAYFASPEGLAEIGEHTNAGFRLGSGEGVLFELDYVGAEVDGEFAWIYFTFPAPEETAAFIVDNDLLSAQFDDQVMMTNFRINSLIRTAMQGPGQRNPVRVEFRE